MDSLSFGDNLIKKIYKKLDSTDFKDLVPTQKQIDDFKIVFVTVLCSNEGRFISYATS